MKLISRVDYSAKKLFLSLLIGFIAGLCFGFLKTQNEENANNILDYPSTKRVEQTQINRPNLTDHVHIFENKSIADELFDNVKVLCFIVSKYSKERFTTIYETWGRKCNRLIFISDEEDLELGSIAFTEKEDENLFFKSISGLKYLYNQNYFNDFDWVLKADDETYMVMENIRFMLSNYSNDGPYYFGSKYQTTEGNYLPHNTYILNRNAISSFIENYMTTSSNNTSCNFELSGSEKKNFFDCLESIDVNSLELYDSESNTVFYPFRLLDISNGSNSEIHDMFWVYFYYKSGKKFEVNPDFPLSFHYVSPSVMYILEYLIYHLKSYGIWTLPHNMLIEAEE